MRMPGCLGFGLGWNLLASREFKARLRHGYMALALLKLMHLFDILCPVNARILGCYFWVPFWGSTLEVLGPRNVDLFIKAAFIGQRFWGPKNGPLFKLSGANFQDQKTGRKKVPQIPDFVSSFSGII